MKLYRKLNKVMKAENHLKNGTVKINRIRTKKTSRTLMAILVMMLSITSTFAQSDWRSSMGTNFWVVFPDGMPSSGGQFTITIESTFDWTVSCNETWITISSASGSKNGTITVTVAPNTTTSQRTGSVEFWTILEDGRNFRFSTFSFSVAASDAVNVEEETPVGADGTGKILLNLTVPADVLFTGLFQLLLPNGMKLDTTLTRLASHLSSQLKLTITENTDGSWLFTITSQTVSRSSSEMTYSEIVEIVYTVDETVQTGKYEAVISNLSFQFNDGTTIVEDELPVTITVNSSTGIPPLLLESSTYIINGILYIQSPFVETVQIFSLSGMLISNFQKMEGTAIYPVNQLKNTIVIVKGSSGWSKKIIVQ